LVEDELARGGDAASLPAVAIAVNRVRRRCGELHGSDEIVAGNVGDPMPNYLPLRRASPEGFDDLQVGVEQGAPYRLGQQGIVRRAYNDL
jgi:hypothetical protein